MATPDTPPQPTKAVQKWADEAMFSSAPLDATTGPQVHVLSMNPDPLGEIAAAKLMYQGVVVKDLAEITDDQRREAWNQIMATKLKAPFEFVKMHLLFDAVTRSWTHQLVRQRTAAYAQESLRFAVVEDEFTSRVALPPSLAGSRELSAIQVDVDLGDYDRLSERDKMRFLWERNVLATQVAYTDLVNMGMPAEDARGLLPHNITTRVHYTTDLRALIDHAGNRLCTQAQFEWRVVFIKLVQALREYGESRWYYRPGPMMGDIPSRESWSSAWQFDLIADAFRPACYLTGKCEFAAMDLDRKCSIRDRVDGYAARNVPSSRWDQGYTPLDNEAGPGVGPIHPTEWLADPGAAR